jgi:ketosteroid isomerase-like protein
MAQIDEDRKKLVERLFAAWSSGDPDAPRDLLHPDAVLDDAVGGPHHGWEAIRAYFAHGLERYPDLRLVPTGEWWTREDGLALTWEMSATAQDDRHGEGTAGRRWTVQGMSYVVFDADGLVVREVDYHDAGARARSLASG